MKHLIIVLKIILLCFICISSVRAVEEEPLIKKQQMPTKVEEIVEYEDAHFIWNYLKDLGYSDVTVAGIMGNIMVEVGGNTLELQSTAETSRYYGICQWKKEYFPEVIGVSLEEQCNFLRDNIEYEIKTFHPRYSYKDFLAIEDVREAASAFAIGYERCGEGTYTLRQDCAEAAYEYFVNQNNK